MKNAPAVKHRYDYFKYSLPPESAELYAERALTILRGLRDRFPAFYELFRSPSEVLTLSGVRAFDTYYELGEDAQQADVDALADYLKTAGILLVDETFAVAGENNPEKRYSLIHMQALHEIPARYGYVPEWLDLNFADVKQPSDFFFWWLSWKERIGSAAMSGRIKKMPDRWGNSWRATHNITFGILLGYPGEAICSDVQCEEDYLSGIEMVGDVGRSKAELDEAVANGATITTNARIQHADKYAGAQPVYYYEASLKTNQHIVAHEKLWSDILTLVYAGLDEE
jgi:hypothetical protein